MSSEPVSRAGAATHTVFDVLHGTALETLSLTAVADTTRTMASSREALARWAETSLRARADGLARCAGALTAHTDKIVNRLVQSLAMCATDALSAELLPAVAAAKWLADNGPVVLSDSASRSYPWAHRETVTRRLPRGVVVVLSPTNAPVGFALSVVFSALMAGNAVVLKPSLRASGALSVCLDVLSGALPSGIFTVCHGDRALGDALIDAAPEHVVFIGRPQAARRVTARCVASGVSWSTCVDGSAPAIVCRDADLERAARAIVFGRFAHAGQRRASIERVYVHARLHDALVARLVSETSVLRVGDPSRADVDMGPLIEEGRAEVLRARVREAVLHGATVAYEAPRLTGELSAGRWFSPTVISHCRPEMALVRAPLAGPVLPVVNVADEAVAMRAAREPSPGPVAFVFSESEERAAAVASGIESGAVLVNDVMAPEALIDTAMVGDGRSSHGVLLGAEGLIAMTRTQKLGLPRWRELARDPWWPPYSSRKSAWLRHAVTLFFGRFGFDGRTDDLR